MAEREVPQYRKIADELRAAIEVGELAGRLPSSRDLRSRYDASSAVVDRAVELLRSWGLVVSRPGSGVYVREFRAIRRSSPARLDRERWGAGLAIQDTDTGDRPRVADVEVGETAAPDWVAGPLGVEPGTPVVFRRRRYLVEGRPVQLATSYLVAALVRGTAITYTDTGPGGLYARLAELGHAPVRFTEQLRARMPRLEELAALELPDGTPVQEVTRHAYTESGACVEVNRMVLDGTAYVLDYEFPA